MSLLARAHDDAWLGRKWNGRPIVAGDRFRQALAYEAAVTDAHLGYKTFPKSRRPYAEQQVERMRSAARGDGALYSLSSRSLESARREAGMGRLTRWQWENER